MALGQVDTAVDGTVLTGTVPLVGQAIVLRAIGEGEAVTVESVMMFPTTVILTGYSRSGGSITPREQRATVPALEPGASVLVIGTIVSDTLSPSVYSITVPLAAIPADKQLYQRQIEATDRR